MKLRLPWSLLLTAFLSSDALVAPRAAIAARPSHLAVSATLDTASVTPAEGDEAARATRVTHEGGGDSATVTHHEILTHQSISSLRFRELKRELEARGAPTDGTTSLLRTRLRAVAECVIRDDGIEECGPDVNVSSITTCCGAALESSRSRYILTVSYTYTW
jgi:hypothetical protein